MKKFRKYLLIAGLLAFAPLAVSCGGDDPDEPVIPGNTENGGNGGTTPGGGGSTTPADPTATYQVKSGIVHRYHSLKEYKLDGSVASYYGWEDCGPCIYEDFYVKYVLVFDEKRRFGIAPFVRENSYWSHGWSDSYYYEQGFFGSDMYYSTLELAGKSSNLSAITEVSGLWKSHQYQQDIPKVSPDTGYYGSFRITDTDEVRHIRILVTGYTLDEDDRLASVNIQYQLYD